MAKPVLSFWAEAHPRDFCIREMEGCGQRYRWKHSEPLRLLAMTKSHQDRPAHEPIALPKGLPHELLLHSTGRAFVSASDDAIQISDRPCQVLVIDSMLLYSRSLSCPMGPAS
jgi:hypothetical protein